MKCNNKRPDFGKWIGRAYSGKTSVICIIFARLFVLFQPAFTYSKLTIETLEQRRKLFKVNNKDTRTTTLCVFLILL